MREIKFRCWNGEQMVNEGWVTAGGQFWECAPDSRLPGESRDWPVMLSTNLHDRKGKEIYEGDIIRFHKLTKNPKKLLVVKWENDLGEDGFIVGYEGLSSTSSNGEVIGNIYENPDVLR